MACPDELTLDLWLADALPSEEAAVVAAHVRTCATCAAAQNAAHSFASELQAALGLNTQELAYLAGQDLSRAWRTSPAPLESVGWGWIALIGVIAGFCAWLVAAP